MNGLLLHLALAQARTRGNAVSGAQAGDREKLDHFFSAPLYFLSLSACEAAARRVCLARLSRAGRHCSISAPLQHRPGLQTGARRGQGPGRPAVITGWTGGGHHRPVPGRARHQTPEQSQATAPCAPWPVWRAQTGPQSAVCSHQSVLQRAPSPAAGRDSGVTLDRIITQHKHISPSLITDSWNLS